MDKKKLYREIHKIFINFVRFSFKLQKFRFMTNYRKSRKCALRLCKKLYDARLVDCPNGMDKASLCNIAYAIGLQVLDLCNNECFLEDFEHLLETSDGTPKSRKESGL